MFDTRTYRLVNPRRMASSTTMVWAISLWTVAAVAQEQPAELSNNSALEEIVVTAQRRAERMQDVPIALNAVSGDHLENVAITGTASLVAVVPSLVFTRQASGATPYLRGVGFATGDINAENSVAMYIDGAYQPVPSGNFFELNNIDRIEVLKGPQGTLFGRNATGGVIQVLTRDPVFEPHMEVAAGYANFSTASGKLYGTVGLSDKVAVDLAAIYSDQTDGWGRNLTTGADTFRRKDYSLRSKLLIAPGEATKIVLGLDYYYYKNSGIGAQPVFGLSGDPAGLTGNPPVASAVFPGNVAPGTGFPGRYNTLGNFEDGAHANNRGASLRLEHDFGAVQLRSITAYRKFDGVWQLDQDMSPVNIISARFDQRAKTFSEEIHLLAPAEAKFQWLIGGYYFRHDATFDPAHLQSDFAFLDLTGVGAIPPLGSLDIVARTIATSKSFFAQGSYPLTDTVSLTLGARYTDDDSDYTGAENGNLLSGGSIPLVPENTGTLSYRKPTWRVSLDHKFTDDVLGYVSYNRGLKSGNFSVSVPVAAAAVYQPEQLDAYEIGVKSELLSHRIRLNAAGFYYDYTNMQFQKIVQGSTITLNADSAKIYGAEVELEARATDALTLTANAGYLHTRIGDFPFVATVRLLNGLSANTPLGLYNAEGNRTPNSPQFSGNVGFNYEIPTQLGAFNLSANLYYRDKYFNEPDNRLFVDSHVLLSAGASWTDPADKLSVRIWGSNLTNEYFYAQQTGQDGTADLGGPAAPRMYGVTLGYKF